MSGYVVAFLILVGVWCAAGRFFATRPVIATALIGSSVSVLRRRP
jgi:hypothetical protein